MVFWVKWGFEVIFGVEGVKVKSWYWAWIRGCCGEIRGFSIFGLSRLLLSRSGVFYLFRDCFLAQIARFWNIMVLFFLQIKIRQLFYDQGGFFRPWCFLKIKLIFQDVRRLFKINRVKLFELFFTLSDHPSFLFFEGDTFVVKVGAFEDRGISFLVKIRHNFLRYVWLFMISSVLFHDQGRTFYFFRVPLSWSRF